VPYLDRNGVRLHYEDDGAGPAVLLTHGFTATARMWEPQVAALTDRYRLIRWDMRGHGQSDAPDDPALYSHDLTVEDMRAVLDACDVDRAVVAGLSLGGFMSMLFNLIHADRVRALMLLDTGPGYKSDASRADWNRSAENNARAIEEKGGAGLIQSNEIHTDHHRTLAGLPHVARGMLIQTDARVIESLPSISVPTLVMVGAQDKPFLDAMAYMARKIPGARYEVVAGAGHAVNIDQPERVNTIVTEFLEALPAWAPV
jgi:pimeloyl-ACP methyl ester carboxylesterase